MLTIFGYPVSINDAKLAIWHLVLFFISFCVSAIGFSLVYGPSEELTSQAPEIFGSGALFAALLSAATLTFGLDARSLESRSSVFPIRLILGVVATGVLLTLLATRYPNTPLNGVPILAALLVAFLATLASRKLAARFLAGAAPSWRVLIVGTGKSATAVRELITRSGRSGLECIGCYGAEPNLVAHQSTHSEILDSNGSLYELAMEANVHEIVVALDDRRGALPIQSLLAAKLRGIKVTDLVSFYEHECKTIKFELLHPSWIIFSKEFRLGRTKRSAKRAFDLLASLTMLVLVAPLFLLVIAASLLESRGRHPVFYSQDRVGLGGRTFLLHKFRSMTPDAEPNGRARWADTDDNRVTSLGKILRRYRIDELPQLLNIMKGDMSLVGPRPERPAFVKDLARDIPYYNERHCVPPGLTGWAQLMYPYGASVEDAKRKLEFDLYYIKHTSVALDLVILLRTLEVVVSGRGAH